MIVVPGVVLFKALVCCLAVQKFHFLTNRWYFPADSRCTVLRKQDSGDVPVSYFITLTVVC